MGTCQSCETQPLQIHTKQESIMPPPLTAESLTLRQKKSLYSFENGAIYTGEWVKLLLYLFGLVNIVMAMVCKCGQILHPMRESGKTTRPVGREYSSMPTVMFVLQNIITQDDGEWYNDKAQGYGVYIHANGSKFEGFWEDDKQHGVGTEIWVDGSKYEGMYKQGMKDGNGTYHWPDGKVYQGQWQQNKMTGFGTCHWKDGRIYRGGWLENNMHGHGKYITPEGKCYEGDYYFDKKHGYGTFTWSDGRKYSGNWKSGKQHGKGMIVIESIKKWGMWEDGRRVRWIEEED